MCIYRISKRHSMLYVIPVSANLEFLYMCTDRGAQGPEPDEGVRRRGHHCRCGHLIQTRY